MRGIALVPLLAACTATSDLTEHVTISDEGDALTVIATFSIGEFDDIGRHDVDSVVTTFRGEEGSVPCNDSGCRGTIDLAAPLMPDEPFTITVHRGGDTLASTVMIPPRIDLQPAPLFVSRAQDLTLTWSPATADDMRWSVFPSCVDSMGGTIPPNLTTVTIPAGSLERNDNHTCSTGLILTRIRETPASDGFAGGHVDFITTANTSFASTP